MSEYLKKGEKGLPPHTQEMDPMESDDEYEARILK